MTATLRRTRAPDLSRTGRRGAVSAILALAFCTTAGLAWTAPAPDYIDGRVRDPAGTPEAGVWVIAETTDLPTPFRKIVATDDAGRFALPELPQGTYELWVRGYGLVDSLRVQGRPGDTLDLTAVPAPGKRDAAAIYPASYWLSLLHPPQGDPGWTSAFKLGCQLCHQVGSTITRYRTREAFDAGLRKSTFMDATATGLGRDQLLDVLADWSARIMSGETPAPPPRPVGIERNLVITEWAWGDGFTYAHDEIATDKRNPSRYANGPVYGVDLANDRLLIVDPQTNSTTEAEVPTIGGFDVPWCDQTYQASSDGSQSQLIPMGFGSLGCPTASGTSSFEGRYDNPANPHNPMLDSRGRVWITTQVRREWDVDLPAFCSRSPGIAGRYHHRQLGWFDTKTRRFELIDTCFGTHHLQFDGSGRLWTSGDSYVIGWFDPDRYDPDRPETLAEAQGWSEIVVDSNGDGKADMPIVGFNYGIIPNPLDHSVWTAQPGGNPGEALDYRGRLVRYDPATDTHETYVPPAPGSGPRGVDVDSHGIIWASLGGSGHLARFDRSKCRQTWGPGDQCPEGWRLYRSPGPVMQTGSEAGAVGADFHYYLFVDQHDTLGLGKDVVIMNGTGSDSLLAFRPETEEFVVIRIPYPLNTYTRGLDGRIDDPAAGWKGRGLWFTNGLDPIHHSELPRSFVGRVQLRPDPLAR
ncbi:MAG: carboxypeptidase regulatory-like domain-containing protein [Pseudomonadales bacterium]